MHCAKMPWCLLTPTIHKIISAKTCFSVGERASVKGRIKAALFRGWKLISNIVVIAERKVNDYKGLKRHTCVKAVIQSQTETIFQNRKHEMHRACQFL
jgi:hypothetical protein